MTNPAPDPRLQRSLGLAALDGVRQKLRRRFEQAEPGTAPDVIRLTGLDPAAHCALCQLIGRSSHATSSMTLNIPELDERLRGAGLANSLRDALERLEGPIVPHAWIRKERQARWTALVSSANTSTLLRAWLDAPNTLILLKRLGREPEQAARVLAAADTVLKHLPAKGLTRSQLAADTLGDAHALDAGRPVATLVLAVWRHHEQTNRSTAHDSPEIDEATESTATGGHRTDARQRDIWARAGILVNELARPALLLNLPPPLNAPCTWIASEPSYLSLRQLLRYPPSWPVAGRRIFICENPNIVAIAADRLGANCAPLICTDGMPAAAQRVLLNQLAAAGARLYYHGDYDWPGITIGNHVMRTWRAKPWRFGTRDYLAAATGTPLRPRELNPPGIEAIWDPELGPAMRQHGLAIAEEAVVDTLLEQLTDTNSLTSQYKTPRRSRPADRRW